MNNGCSLCEWLIPLPGGFHIDKQAMLEFIKICLLGAGLEELLPVSRLCEYSHSTFSCLTHYGKNQQVVFPATGASAIRLTARMVAERPSLVDKINPWIGEGVNSGSYPSQVTLRKCHIRLTDVVTPGILETGSLVYKGAMELGHL